MLFRSGQRTVYGKRQLLAALKIAQDEDRDPATMTSSWAGAFGHTQFVPTTYLEQAVDGDGDGKRDLWDSPADALASTAHYLKNSGWRADENWGREVVLPESFAFDQARTDIRKSLDAWGKLGVTAATGEALMGDSQGFIFLPAGHGGPAFLVMSNFNAILRYNNATSYALAIGLLADRLTGGPELTASWPVNDGVFDTRQNKTLQEGLTALGFDTGGTDGVFGARSREALRDYQRARGLTPDGYPTPQLFTRILNEWSARR